MLRAAAITGTLLVLPAQAQDLRAGAARQDPIPEPVSAVANPHPLTAAATRGDTHAAARGRRIVSTVFVRLGPQGWMQLTTHAARALVLRSVTMEPGTVCGITVAGRASAERRCIDYAQVVAARAIDAPGGRLSGGEPSAEIDLDRFAAPVRR